MTHGIMEICRTHTVIPLFQPCPPSELRLKWRRLPDMPKAMLPQSVTVYAAVYVAARERFRVIHRYDLQSQQWTTLPEYHYIYFAMTQVSSQLTLIGGWFTGKTTNTVSVYSTSQRSWKQPFPPMKTPRYHPAVSTYHQHLVVAGGCAGGTDLASVEILDTSTRRSQWLSATRLPVSCHLMSAAIIHNMLYLLGGTLGTQVLSVSLSAITQTDKSPAQWRTLPNAPLEYSTAIAVHGFLLAVGGSHDEQSSSAIHVYDQEKNTWTKVGNLPTARSSCACCLLPGGEVLVAGGQDIGWTSRMDAATID